MWLCTADFPGATTIGKHAPLRNLRMSTDIKQLI